MIDFIVSAWWPLVAGFVLAWVLRLVGSSCGPSRGALAKENPVRYLKQKIGKGVSNIFQVKAG